MREKERDTPMDLSVLQALEREKVLEVLQRDKLLRSREEERIRRLKSELQEIKRKGAKSFSRQYSEKTCARCQRPLGKFWNSGSVCRGCSHRICSKCRVGESAMDWKCTVCHAYREVKIRSGEWFLEERAKKYPAEPDRHETVGEKLLKSYQRLSHISVVPPTPPPYYDGPSFSRYGTLKNSKPFTKSVEDLMASFTSHIKKISKSQTDVRDSGLQDLLTVTSRRQSFSDTDINKTNKLTKGPSLPSLFKKNKDSDLSGPEEDTSLGSEYSGQKRGSTSRTSTDCSLFEHVHVTGDLELAIAFNDITSCLEITVRACRNLTFGDIKRKKCHPYVKIYLLPDKSQSSKMKTTIKRNTTDPVYDEVLQCQIERPQLSGRTLQASVWHSGTLKKVFLGEVLIPLEGWMFQDRAHSSSVCYSLCPKGSEGGVLEQSRREILVRIKFSSLSQPSWVCKTDEVQIGLHDDGQLTVLITGAKNLPTKTNSSQNTYVKGCLAIPRSSGLLQRTHVMKVKPRAGWSHQLVFSRVTPSDLLDSTLHMELWDQSPFSLPDRPMGVVRMEPGSPWQLALQMPNMWHDFHLPVQVNINV
ncbi:synaptotagmin-like protein 3 [Osmerus mordax]|uniref:synaptotagmin-like protein 3 n=1 Tax=Osmerus mordax TaxID=8014 RepID=UPI00350F923A